MTELEKLKQRKRYFTPTYYESSVLQQVYSTCVTTDHSCHRPRSIPLSFTVDEGNRRVCVLLF